MNRFFSLLLLTILILIPLVTTALAEDPSPIRVKAEVDRAFITIGDEVEYTVLIKHLEDVKLLSSIPAPPKKVFKLKKIKDIRDQEGPYIIVGKTFTLTSFRLGEFVLDPVKVEYRKGAEAPESIETNPLYLKVKSIAEGEELTDIRGIKGVLGIPKVYVRWILFTLILVIALLAGWFFFKMRKKAGDEKPAEPAMSPEEEAFFYLNQLFDSDLLRREKIKPYYFRLSEILRAYFERRFHILAIESTTFEITRALKSKNIPSTLRHKMTEVLEAADLAKFAKWKPDPAETLRLNQKSKEIIEESMPKQEEVPSGV